VSRNLQRILRVRRLLEDLAHLELEKKTAEMRRLETAAAGQRSLALAARTDAMQILEGRKDSATPDWLMGIADAEILAWKGGRLAALARARRPDIEAARAELLGRRLDRRQLESLAAEAAQAELQTEVRREQKQADDWFQSRVARAGRGQK
jgi:hypothetical protein